MSFNHTRLLWQLLEDEQLEIPPSARIVLLRLADRANDFSLAWPSINSIARDTGQGRRTVIRALQLLEQAGLIVRTNRRDLTREERRNLRLQNVVYRLNLTVSTGVTVAPVEAGGCHGDTSSGVTVAHKPTNNLPGNRNQPAGPPLGERAGNQPEPTRTHQPNQPAARVDVAALIKQTKRGLSDVQSNSHHRR